MGGKATPSRIFQCLQKVEKLGRLKAPRKGRSGALAWPALIGQGLDPRGFCTNGTRPAWIPQQPWSSSPDSPFLLDPAGKSVFLISLTRIRDRQLSKPKREWGSPVRRLDWGNQETIRSVSASALRAGLSERLEFLARPKKVHSSLCRPKYLYSCGRESSIWKYPPGVTFSYPSERILKLAEPKRVHESYLKLRPRSSPEWPVSRAALTCEASEHLKRLSQAKLQHQDYCPPRTVETQIPRTALRAQASQRLTSLSQPKVKSESLVLDLGRKEEPIRWGIRKSCSLQSRSLFREGKC
ncbi:testicular haploid expressed gene protein-like isoform X3 [Ornithorhynchus anatinus]|uniref:testicular haploid expressed gene protein-like isoform X3 n=1 Tax=Ornithorhynchus anatinus TaxID=9258 RepID=UPI0010A86E9C|nr:testicular haploid expressed gene protein-like isoform X3 [Ornithorhynchus anatinus]